LCLEFSLLNFNCWFVVEICYKSVTWVVGTWRWRSILKSC
jgi:hypothetical protein